MTTRAAPTYALWLLLAAMVALAWSNLFGGDYCFDDVSVISECRAIESWRNMPDVFSPRYSAMFRELSYRPTVTLSYFLDGALMGKRPALSRALNLALHAVAAVALFALWWRLFGSRVVAFFASALFAVHPLATAAVNSPGFREEILCLVLMLASMHAALASLGGLDGRPLKRWAWASALLWLGALGAKEPAAMMPALLILALARSPAWSGVVHLAWAVHRRSFTWLVLPFLFVFSVYVSLYAALGYHAPEGASPALAQGASAAAQWPGDFGLARRVAEGTRAIAFYLRLWVFPRGLSINHWFFPSGGWGDWRLGAALALWCAMLVGAVALWRRGRLAAGLGAAWTLAMFMPLMQFVPTPEYVAERYAYLPLVGLSLMLAGLVLREASAPPASASRGAFAQWAALVANRRRLALVAVLLVCMALTWRRNRDWRDDYTLNMAAYGRWHNARGHLAMGALEYGRRDLESAMRHFQHAVRMQYDLADAHRNIALIYLELGNLKRAEASLRVAERQAPDDPRTRQALDILTREKARLEDESPTPESQQ